MSEGAGLDENLAGTLCYAGLWLTGLIFFLIDKRQRVRFHAAQSMVVFGGLAILYYIVARIFFGTLGPAGYGLFSVASLFLDVIGLVIFVLWIVLMIKTYQGETLRIPVAAEIADGIAGK
jgi:uncharacterized membrane protein